MDLSGRQLLVIGVLGTALGGCTRFGFHETPDLGRVDFAEVDGLVRVDMPDGPPYGGGDLDTAVGADQAADQGAPDQGDADQAADQGAPDQADQGSADLVALDQAAQDMMIACPAVTVPPLTPPTATCTLRFDPWHSVPCEIATPGPQYYVDAQNGLDQNAGDSPAAPWATLCRAMASAPDGSTIRVAAGVYATAAVNVDRPLVVKGGYDATFTSWDPDQHASFFVGRLTLDHANAVWGGFRMIVSQEAVHELNPSHAMVHRISSGSLVRNLVQIEYTADDGMYYLFGLVADADAGETSTVRCNDIYLRTEKTGFASMALGMALQYAGQHRGQAVVDSNRICYDASSKLSNAYVIGGYGTCGPAVAPARVQLTNNIVESAHASGTAVHFYACNHGATDQDLELIITNNTIISRQRGIGGYKHSTSAGNDVVWQFANDIVYSPAGGAAAVNVDDCRIAKSEHNLTFGFGDNGIQPAPDYSAGDDTSGGTTADAVFIDPQTGDLRPEKFGPATATGLNVFGMPDYGAVTVDLAQQIRPAGGPWDRGAYVH